MHPRHCVLGIAALGLMVAVLGGCTPGTSTSSTEIAGTVTDRLGNPIAGATVSLVDQSSDQVVPAATPAAGVTQTSARGDYEMELPDLTTQLTVSKAGYHSYRVLIPAVALAGEIRNVDLTAEEGGPTLPMDTNFDGNVSYAEWTGAPEVFVAADANFNGILTPAEIDEALHLRIQRHPKLGRMDSKGDGLIRRDDWIGPVENFLELDTDGDGQLKPAEIKVVTDALAAAGAATPTPTPTPGS